ncbi:unnamed protein product [marine sediment metagenome]|uniref:Uncharacterized protein n=1 Tax=marine sediment metagenome TaxID=412755 RepID=X1PAF1_9ZZZZ
MVDVGHPFIDLVLFSPGDYELPLGNYPGPAILTFNLANPGSGDFPNPGLFLIAELLALANPGIALDALPADRIGPDTLRLVN